MRQRGPRETEGCLVCIYGGEVDQLELYKSLSKVTLWRRTKEATIDADTLEETLTKKLPYTKTFT